jgi:putative peptidoglycan binding protein
MLPIRLATASILAALALLAGGAAAAHARAGDPSAFRGTGMWIHELPESSGGDPAAIAAKARQYGVTTLIVKAANGGDYWEQFSPSLVSALKSRGLKVCAYQRLLGGRPGREAKRAVSAINAGADCFVIDAEAEYEGKYRKARRYVRKLRRRIDPDYPVGLTSFPYVHFHPEFPYSAFFGPGGAEYNLPQMYWKAIGVSIRRIYRTTYRYNRAYDQPIYPLGQVWQSPPTTQIHDFRRFAAAYGAKGLSWWVYQLTSRRSWTALGDAVDPPSGITPTRRFPTLGEGSKGDLVRWAQLHLTAAGHPVKASGSYGGSTTQAVLAFERANGLGADGAIDDAATWKALLRHRLK